MLIKRMPSQFELTTSRFVLIALLFMVVTFRSYAQGEGANNVFAPNVIVTLGKPNIWTMEQAHYLLEKNRAHDLGIAATDVGPLDANEIVGYRLEALKSLLSAQVQYDAVTGKKNSAELSQYNLDMARYNLLRNQLDSFRGRQAGTAGELATAQYQLTVLQAQSPPDEKKIQLQNAEIARLQGQQSALNSEVSSLSQAMGTEPSLSSLTSSVPSSDVTSQSAIGTNATFSKMLDGLPATLSNSKVQASIRLDNYINLQYEIVAKQLTLLRDEVGPNKRVVFVELPQSIYVTHKFKPYPDLAALWGSHLVQTWWRLDKIISADREHDEQTASPGDLPKQLRPPPDLEAIKSACNQNKAGSATDRERQKLLYQFFQISSAPQPSAGNNADQAKSDDTTKGTTDAQERAGADTSCKKVDGWNLGYREVSRTNQDPDSWAYSLDLIPRQSALNVAEAHSTSRAYGFAGLFGFLTGFGARGRYDRRGR